MTKIIYLASAIVLDTHDYSVKPCDLIKKSITDNVKEIQALPMEESNKVIKDVTSKLIEALFCNRIDLALRHSYVLHGVILALT
jgi:hypothetical protein